MFRYNEVTMRATASLLLRLVCSLTLLFSALPTRAGVVCVENGRVVGQCRMTSIPERAVENFRAQPPAMARMACCRPHVAKTKASVSPADACPTHKKTRCAYAYRSGLPSIASAEHQRAESPRLALVAVLHTPADVFQVAAAATWSPGIIGTDSGPPMAQTPRGLSGRAPPTRRASS